MSPTLISTTNGVRTVWTEEEREEMLKAKEEPKMVYDEIVIGALKTAIEVADKEISDHEDMITELKKKREEIVKKIQDMTHEVNGGKQK